MNGAGGEAHAWAYANRWLVGLGVAFGLPLAMVATRSIEGFPFGLPPVDTLGIGAAILSMVVGFGAGRLSAGPARDESRSDDSVAMGMI